MDGSTDLLSGLRRIHAGDEEELIEFLAALPEGDRTFLKEADDRATIEFWCRDLRSTRWVLERDGRVEAYLAIIPGVGWSHHVGELRLIVAAGARRLGLGRALARHGLLEALRSGLAKVVVEVAAEKQGDLDMFTSIGFKAEALLENHVRTREGQTGDLVILSHDVEAVRDSMHALGIDEATGVDLGAGA